MTQWVKNFHRDSYYKKTQAKTLELESIVTKIKNSLDGFSSRFEMAEE